MPLSRRCTQQRSTLEEELLAVVREQQCQLITQERVPIEQWVGVDHLEFDNQYVTSINDLHFIQEPWGQGTVITYFDEAAPAAIEM